MITDAQLAFEPISGTAITASQVSTNQIDFGPIARDLGSLGAPDCPMPEIVVACLTNFASATPTATLTIGLQAAPDNGSGSPGAFVTVASSPATPLGQLQAGNRPYIGSLPVLAQNLGALAPVTGTFSCASGASTIAVASTTGLLVGQFLASAGIIVPGTQIVSISGLNVTISANTVAAASAGTSFAAVSTLGNGGPVPTVRFLQLTYTASAAFSAGRLFAAIVLETDRAAIYAPQIQNQSVGGHWTLAGP